MLLSQRRVSLWHLADVATDLNGVCCWGKTGRIQTRLCFPSIPLPQAYCMSPALLGS